MASGVKGDMNGCASAGSAMLWNFNSGNIKLGSFARGLSFYLIPVANEAV